MYVSFYSEMLKLRDLGGWMQSQNSAYVLSLIWAMHFKFSYFRIAKMTDWTKKLFFLNNFFWY